MTRVGAKENFFSASIHGSGIRVGHRRLGVEQLPASLGEAIEITAESELVLRTLGEHMFNRYIEIKRQEWEDYRVQVTPWELERYLSIL
jgi:glutamine synthetase